MKYFQSLDYFVQVLLLCAKFCIIFDLFVPKKNNKQDVYTGINPSDGKIQLWSCAAGKIKVCSAIQQRTEESQVARVPAAERSSEEPSNRKGRKTPFHSPAGHWGWGDMVHWATLGMSDHLLSICTNMLHQMNCHPPEKKNCEARNARMEIPLGGFRVIIVWILVYDCTS